MRKHPFTVGIVGGMGALAGVRLQELIIRHTPAQRDQEQVPVICFTNPTIPDRTEALRVGRPESFVLPIIQSARVLIQAGADKIFIPCNTTHLAFKDIQAKVSIPIYHLIEETVAALEHSGKKKLVILGTPFIASSALYESRHNCYELMRPDESDQRTITDLIYRIKGNDFSKSSEVIQSLLEKFEAQGADGYILGCTELSLLRDILGTARSLFDPLDIAAKNAVSEFITRSRMIAMSEQSRATA